MAGTGKRAIPGSLPIAATADSMRARFRLCQRAHACRNPRRSDHSIPHGFAMTNRPVVGGGLDGMSQGVAEVEDSP